MKVDGLDDGDDVVWRREASYVDGTGVIRFLVKFLTRQEERALLEAFGRDWLNDYLAENEREVERFRLKGVH